jgi:hypothetical protein
VSLDNIMDSITLHSSNMFLDLAHSLKWSTAKCSPAMKITADGSSVALRGPEEYADYQGQGTVLGLREYTRTEVHSWVVRLEQVGGGRASRGQQRGHGLRWAVSPQCVGCVWGRV